MDREDYLIKLAVIAPGAVRERVLPRVTKLESGFFLSNARRVQYTSLSPWTLLA